MAGDAGGRRIVLHLGMHKTGSSSIQTVFQGYRDERIEYADLGVANHSLVLQRCFEEGHGAKGEAARRRLAKALEGTGRSVILSGEGLSHFDAASARRCAGFLRERVERIEPILYVRGPLSYARSAFQERIKFRDKTFELGRLVPPYRDRAMRWAEALGVEPTYVLFDRASLREGDVVTDFAWRLGLDPAWAAGKAREHNVSLSAEATAALYLMRHVNGPVEATKPARMRQRRVVEALQGFGTRRFDFAPEAMAQVLAARARDIAWMEERLGRPFPDETVKDAVVFGSERDVLDYAEAQAPALEAHLRAKGLAEGPGGRSTAELLDELAGRRVAASDLRREIAARRQGPRSLLRSLVGRIAAGWR